MGLNFYCVRLEPSECGCPCCDRIHYNEKTYHIGKSSAGWVFAVAQSEELGIYSWEDWKLFLSQDLNYERVEEEEGREVTFEELIGWVEDRFCGDSQRQQWTEAQMRDYIENEYGKPFGTYIEGNKRCGSNWKAHRGPLPLPGPSGLLRHPIGDGLCVAHGSGTWDVMKGEFS